MARSSLGALRAVAERRKKLAMMLVFDVSFILTVCCFRS
jgi:hypothetical protein